MVGWRGDAVAGLISSLRRTGRNRVHDRLQSGGRNHRRGNVRGCDRAGIYTFKGIPYGAPTGGASRFQPPAKPAPWRGIRSTLTYGPICPVGIDVRSGGDNRPHGDEDSFLLYRGANHTSSAEDCLRLNVWTPGLSGTSKRPVMVWLHGGGFTAGSGHDLLSYDGENLARRGDVMVITNNHRLNALGYLDLAGLGGERYAASANVGMLDIVAVLEWVRDNAAAFGGDPGNVTIFGQSGGGGKVSTLMAMPAAKGLFHKAIVQSGAFLRAHSAEDSARLAAAFLAELNVSKSRLEELHTIPVERLCAAQQRAAGQRRLAWGPSVDGHVLPTHPFDPVAPALSASIPLLIGTNLNEGVHGCDESGCGCSYGRGAARKRVEQRHGEKAAAIIDAYRREYPKAKPFDLLVRDLRCARAEEPLPPFEPSEKAAQGTASAYQYLFAWQTPMPTTDREQFHSYCPRDRLRVR